MFHLKLKDTLKHSIATVTSHMDSFVYNPGRDYSRIRKLSPDHVISFLISQGASSTKCEFLDFFQMSEDLPSISALNQRRSQMMPEALEAVFHEFTSSSEKLELSKQEQQYQYIAADGSTTSFFSFSKYSSDDYFISEGHSASGFYSMVYISHRMNEILEICDRVTVIRDGKKVITEKVENLTMEEIVAQMIGAAAAAYFVSEGMTPGEAVYVYEGDTSSVTSLRDSGFTEYLTGELEYDGETIADDKKWTEDDLKSITYSGAMNWSRSDTKTSFESLLGDSANADIKWFYAEDDELAMGILEALQGGGIDDATKEAFLGNKPYITGCGGLDELYAVMRGESFQDIAEQCGGIVSVTYSPAMIQTAIQDMVDHLDGEEVEQDHVIACEIVNSDNVKDYPSF